MSRMVNFRQEITSLTGGSNNPVRSNLHEYFHMHT